MYNHKIGQVVCGTGHRPEKLGGYSTEALDPAYKVALKVLEFHEPSKVITGMAQGWDQMLAFAAYELKIPYIAAVPFEGQEKRWTKDAQDKYKFLCDRADAIVTLSQKYEGPWVMQNRNEWMVNGSDVVLVLWDGSDGGTKNCIKYALSKNVIDKRQIDLVNYWKMFEEYKFISRYK